MFSQLHIIIVVLNLQQILMISVEPAPGERSCPGLTIPIPRGEQGAPGIAGVAGKDGAAGQKGEVGLPGSKGATGGKGEKGDKGSMGEAGVNGTQGLQGDKGEKGTAGTCDANQCSGITTLENKIEEMTKNFTQQVHNLEKQMDYLERNLKYPLGSQENPAISCKEILERDKTAQNGHYYISVTGVQDGKLQVFCYMYSYDGNCPPGLTQVMKIDGSKATFKFSSSYWINKVSYKPENNNEDDSETKLPTYWSTPFTKICLRMEKFGSYEITWKSMDLQGKSLFDLIASGEHHATSSGKTSWLNLLKGSQLQSGCLKEGINVQGKTVNDARARIGVIAGNNCDQTNSLLGFGTQDNTGCNNIAHISCGNIAGCGSTITPSHGHIYVY